MKTPKRRLSIVPGLVWRMAVLCAVLWLLLMGMLTYFSACQLQSKWMQYARISVPTTEDPLPGALEKKRIETMYTLDALSHVTLELPLYRDPTSNRNPYIDPDTSYATAMVFFEDGEPVMTQGDYAVFSYQTAESWLSGSSASDGYAYIDLEATPEGHNLSTGIWGRYITEMYYHADLYRLTGYFQGNQFILTEIATFSIKYPELYEGKDLSRLDQGGTLPWQVQFEVPTEEPTVQLYTSEILSYCHMDDKVRLSGTVSLSEALLSDQPGRYESRSLLETVVIQGSNLTDPQGTEHRVLSAICCRPLFSAMERLQWVYQISWWICGVFLVCYCIFLKRRIQDPLQEILSCGEKNMQALHLPCEAKWEEPYLLQQGYSRAQQELQTLRRENQQLKTALDYAQNAESNRRRMVSNITHELKTPLAVIHSYAEGVLEGIAPEKQQQYLRIITEEADRMDAMVLEMLDLSRLEAGQVRLAQENLELLSLSKGIVQKLSPLLEAKGLEARFSIESPCPLVGDEARLSQVITNLVSNAIKYSPQGGSIDLKVFPRNGFAHFCIENQSQPLSQEALEKVWESFYRTEQSRSSEGTGLGLSICKAIVELHRGSCQVRNTSTGVEFHILLPG